MKNRLSKSIERLKKEKKVSFTDNTKTQNLSSYNVKVFRNLSEKYNLSLTLNENSSVKESTEGNLSLGAQITLERIKKGDVFDP
ncbi:MAG: hypothetical protein ACJ0G4_00425 [Alphaproteobacteria bacterium]